ncbi:NAD(P)-binding Rossmann-like domain-containing protein [Aquimarina amphilecti]|uniref:Tryptophan 2-monooxygenase n=1 Tax=Aquimarina amphilecti TaxID=1038014 RepID=A0A1H7L5I0_AQUAM|nr:FAD-dependent oxidoreductase [Aquimarina amphilecti]SEK93517.1 NAD(P)-binding Rossmann-like domain-containing protein [Aquimarina amphilecti]
MSIVTFSEIPDHDDIDIAIIGAGISGLYCAYRLINHPNYKGKKIAIYERLNRTGGRLQSDLIPIRGNHKVSDENGISNFYDQVQIDLVKEEQGGMRFNYNMEELMTLNGALKICDEIVPFPMSSTDDTNRFCIRGHSFSLEEANAGGNTIWSQLYDLAPQEIGLSPVQIVTNAYNRILEANDIILEEDQTPEYWQKFRLQFKWKGVPMNEWQLWGLLRDMGYSEECIEMLTNTIGFAGPFKSLPNAGDAWQILADFPKDPTYYTFKYGFSTLPDAIKKELEGKVSIYLSTNIDSIHGDEDDFTIYATEATEGENSKPNIPGGKYKTIKTKQIISAIASTGFKALFIKSPALHASSKKYDSMKLWESINGVLGMNLMKINFYFREAWWYTGSTGRPNIEFGPNFTDLPINSIYPFYSVEDLEVDHKKGTVSIISGEEPAALTLYCDFNNTNFWKGLQNIGPKFSSPLQEKYNEMESQTVFPASQAVVAEARKQMGLLFGVTNIPDPIFTSYRLWNGEDDFEHAYHQWQLNVDDKKTIEYLSNPLPGFYMCNEAISDMQGWVNGSLRSSDLALGKISNGAIKPMTNTPCTSPVETKDDKKGKTSLRISRGHWG